MVNYKRARMSSSSEDEGLDDLEFDGESDGDNDIDENILDALEEDLAAEVSDADEVWLSYWFISCILRLMSGPVDL